MRMLCVKCCDLGWKLGKTLKSFGTVGQVCRVWWGQHNNIEDDIHKLKYKYTNGNTNTQLEIQIQNIFDYNQIQTKMENQVCRVRVALHHMAILVMVHTQIQNEKCMSLTFKNIFWQINQKIGTKSPTIFLKVSIALYPHFQLASKSTYVPYITCFTFGATCLEGNPVVLLLVGKGNFKGNV